MSKQAVKLLSIHRQKQTIKKSLEEAFSTHPKGLYEYE